MKRNGFLRLFCVEKVTGREAGDGADNQDTKDEP